VLVAWAEDHHLIRPWLRKDAEPDRSLALVQTPWWVCDFILDLTLLPAAETFLDQTLRTIDPCCGTGHFLIRKIGSCGSCTPPGPWPPAA
jgi:predicted helicase